MKQDVRYPLRDDREKGIAKTTGTQLAYMLRQLNTADVPISLCAQYDQDHGAWGERCVHPDSSYGHLRAALAAILRMLGVPVTSEDEAIQDLVGNGISMDGVLTYYATAK